MKQYNLWVYFMGDYPTTTNENSNRIIVSSLFDKLSSLEDVCHAVLFLLKEYPEVRARVLFHMPQTDQDFTQYDYESNITPVKVGHATIRKLAIKISED